MKTLIAIVLLITSAATAANECKLRLTQSQRTTLFVAIAHAYNSGYRESIAAIIMQESFVGDKIIKINFRDGNFGSFGITHINLDTALYLYKENGRNYAPAIMAQRLIEDDFFAIDTAILKLKSVRNGRTWVQTWNAYNGNDKTYGLLIRDNIIKLRNCGIL
jgi:hypothetical protein